MSMASATATPRVGPCGLEGESAATTVVASCVAMPLELERPGERPEAHECRPKPVNLAQGWRPAARLGQAQRNTARLSRWGCAAYSMLDPPRTQLTGRGLGSKLREHTCRLRCMRRDRRAASRAPQAQAAPHLCSGAISLMAPVARPSARKSGRKPQTRSSAPLCISPRRDNLHREDKDTQRCTRSARLCMARSRARIREARGHQNNYQMNRCPAEGAPLINRFDDLQGR